MTDDHHQDGNDIEETGGEGSPWARPLEPGGAEPEVTWVTPPAGVGAWPPFADPDPFESTTGTGWARRSMAAVVLVGLLAAFVGARILGGPSGPLGANRSPRGGSSASASAPVPPEAAAVAAKVRPGVVDINTELAYQHATASGTGMVLSPSGLVLTNNHVIGGATTITATVVDTGRTYTATVVGTDKVHDIAVLQLKGASGLDTVTVGDSSTVRVGDPVVALGNAGGVGGTPSVKTGTVTSVGQTITVGDPAEWESQQLDNLIVTTAALESGDSGGPLADADGEVVGIDTAVAVDNRFASGESRGFAIPITEAMAIVDQIESGQASDTVHLGPSAFLGVSLVAGAGPGAVVSGVESGSPADSAGLKEGDTITSAGGEAVASPETLSATIRAHHPGDKVTVEWTDGSGTSRSATVKLAGGPAG